MDTQKTSSQLRFKPIQDYLNRKGHNLNDVDFFEQYSIQTYFVKEFQTHLKKGLSAQNLELNKQKYGENVFKQKKVKSFWQFFWGAITDDMLLILIAAAIISLVLEFFYADQHSLFWVDGASILFAVAVCSIVAAVNDYQKQKQFQELNQETQNRTQYEVIRQGERKTIKAHEIVVGDLILIESGLQIPVDGFLVEAINLIVDESSITGESHEVYKDVQSKCISQKNSSLCPSPIMLGGSKILSGEGRIICAVVGQHSQMGKLNQLIHQNAEAQEQNKTPLEAKLQILAAKISYFGIISGVIIFLALCTKYLINDIIPDGWSMNDLTQILKFIIIAVSIIVVAVPEGLPLAVTLSLAFSVKQMLKENNLVRQIMSCQTMGGANFVCTDKTGTLTLNKMQVAELWAGQKLSINQLKQKKIGQFYKQQLVNSIFHNTSAHIRPIEKGSQTEVALIKFAQFIVPTQKYGKYRQRAQQTGYFLRLPFNSDRKRMTTGVSINNQYFVFTKGASEDLIENCDKVLLPNDKTININKLQIQNAIKDMASRGLRTVAIASKTIKSPTRSQFRDRNRIGIEPIEEENFNLLLIAGIKDTCRPEVFQSVKQCKQAGVNIIMVTGDNLITAISIAQQVGIINGAQEQKYCMEGQKFSKLLQNGQVDVEKIKVLARSRPEHKFKLVSQLKKLENTVAVTGDGTNDAPALTKADVGLAMGITGTQIARKAADIILLDDNFSSIIRAIVWGRNIYDSVRKFLQFQLSVNLVAVGLSVVSSAVIGQSVLTAVQMLWVNLIMDSLASLALSTEPPNTEMLLNRSPHSKKQGLISSRMIKHIIGQAIFQFLTLLVLLFVGHKIIPQYADKFDQTIGTDLSAKYNNGQFGGTVVNGRFYDINGTDAYYVTFQKYHIYSRHFTFIFNTFVFMQVFNFFNCRKIHDQIINYLEGIHKNYIYIAILIVIVGFQVIIVELLPTPFKLYLYGLTIQQWLLSVGIASLSIPVSLVLRMINIGKQANEEIDPDSLSQTKKQQNQYYSVPQT